MRKEYSRSDFKKLERGKFYKEAVKGSAVAILDPDIAKSFPSSEAMNNALRGMLEIKEKTAGLAKGSIRRKKK